MVQSTKNTEYEGGRVRREEGGGERERERGKREGTGRDERRMKRQRTEGGVT